MKHLILLIVLLIGLSLKAQNRSDHPFQLQVNLSGVVYKSAGNLLTKKEVIDIDVKEWQLPGLSVGYHLSSKLYLGYAFHPSRRFIFTDTYSFNQNGIDDVLITVDSNTGTQHSLNGRFSPFNFGLYGAVFLSYVSKARYDLEGKPVGEVFDIAGEAYASAFDVSWDFKDRAAFGLGMGYNHVFDTGLSFDIGAGVPIDFIKTVHENVQVIAEDNEFDLDDIEQIRRVIQEDEFYFPLQVYLSVGKNF